MPNLLILRETTPPDVDGRTLTARIATYGRIYTPEPAKRERVIRGAFKSPMARPGGLLRYRHIGERPGDTDSLTDVHGTVTALREDGDAVLAELHVWETENGDKILRLVESGAVTGVSMAALIAESRVAPDGVNDIRRISSLNGVSLTPVPAYDDAQVLREQTSRAAAERVWLAAIRAGLPH